MHGLVNRAVQCFVRDTYGAATWRRLAEAAKVPVAGFESMFLYDDEMTDRMLVAVEPVLGKSLFSFLEDLGTYLVSHPNVASVRRLLRFGGESFTEFLLSVDDLPRRARLAIPELILPTIEVFDDESRMFYLHVKWDRSGFGHLLMGVLRTMADDYGALVLLEHKGRVEDDEMITLQILHDSFSEARPFELGAGLGRT